MKTEILAHQDGSYEARVMFDAKFIAELEHRLPAEIAERAAAAVAEKFLAQRGERLVASIPLEHVLNLAVAKVVVKLSEGK